MQTVICKRHGCPYVAGRCPKCQQDFMTARERLTKIQLLIQRMPAYASGGAYIFAAKVHKIFLRSKGRK